MKSPKVQHLGSIIKLRPEFEEQYIILHKHTFPGVLQSIRRCNIRNYSIFLEDGILFANLEYVGDNHAADMAAIGDEITREWWKFTDPMQEPLETRKEGEWWAGMELLCREDGCPKACRRPVRRAYHGSKESWRAKAAATAAWLLEKGFHNISIYARDGQVYLYMECDSEKVEDISGIEKEFLSVERHAGLSKMREVFYTAGALPAKKVFVTGCFDMLHSGHVAFLKEAAGYGDVYVCIGNDENVSSLKGRYPLNSQEERHYLITALSCVKECRINSGQGIMDFLKELDEISPDIFMVNEDGNTPAKEELCRTMSIQYVVLKRVPHGSLPARSTTAFRSECRIPYRIDLAGGWLDQPFVSSHHPGPVITICIEPTFEFNDRSGMASSTRRKAIELWKTDIPHGDREQLAKVLFSFDNPPGTKEVSGAQDALGIVFPGLNKHYYDKNYWPTSIESVQDPAILDWLENSLHLITLGPRDSGFDVLSNANITAAGARALADAAEACWHAVLSRNIEEFGKQFRKSFEAQVAMFPNMVDEEILKILRQYERRALGWKLAGAGGGGYLILVSDAPMPAAMKIKIRRKSEL
jgi:cytidyltransferase-like protein